MATKQPTGAGIANIDLDLLYESEYSKLEHLDGVYDLFQESYGDDGMNHIDCSSIEFY